MLSKQWTKYRMLLPLTAICIFYIVRSTDFPVHDFANYYFGAKFLANRVFDSQIYFPYAFNKMISDSGKNEIFGSFAPNSPFIAFSFLPFSMLPVAAAKLIFNIISSALLLFSIWRLTKFHTINPFWIAMLPVVFFVPIRNGILFGQVYFILFFLMSEALIAYEKKQWFRTSFLLALSVMIKIFPALLVLIFIFRKQYRPVIFFLSWCVILFIACLPFTGFDIWKFYFINVLPKASNGEIATAFVDNYQSMLMFLKRVFVFDAIENPKGMDVPILADVINNAFKIALIIAGYYITINKNRLFVWSYWIFAALLISPYGSTYSFILMIFAFAAIVKSDYPAWKKTASIAVLFLICNIPLSIMLQWDFPLSYMRLLLLATLFAGIATPDILCCKRTLVAIFIISPIFLFFATDKNPASRLMLYNGPILIGEFYLANNCIHYKYRNQHGENIGSFAFKFKSFENLKTVNGNIIYKNKKLNTENGHKLNAVAIDGKTLIYLSDYGRGIGFYTIRKMNLP